MGSALRSKYHNTELVLMANESRSVLEFRHYRRRRVAEFVSGIAAQRAMAGAEPFLRDRDVP